MSLRGLDKADDAAKAAEGCARLANAARDLDDCTDELHRKEDGAYGVCGGTPSAAMRQLLTCPRVGTGPPPSSANVLATPSDAVPLAHEAGTCNL